ncbi:MAG: NADH:ubiquinone reductase (Na(+)-transporting) subunit C [Saprospiraceae bacterium]|nr:NADH:ubiquinone reductase (Na(+)-transporting) subunit C [Saprospiraceae bacterium]
MHSNRYIIIFVFILTAVVALVLSSMSTALSDTHKRNEAIFNKRAILAAIESEFDTEIEDMSDERILEIFDNRVEQRVVDMEGNIVSPEEVEARGYKGGKAEHVDMAKEKKKPEADRILPVFIYKNDDTKFYIVSVRGSGLWDEIWGNIALKEDFETVAGASFDHKGETPGLGAEIKDNPSFAAQFKGKKIYNEEGEYTSVYVRKGGAKNERYEVDGISGATVTADGVTEMLYRGIKYYQPFFKNVKSEG